MTRLSVRSYEVNDYLDIELMDYEREYRKGQPVDVWAVVNKTSGPAFTVVDPEGRIVFICGVHDVWGRVGEIWAVFSPLAKVYPHTWQVAKLLLEVEFENYDRLHAPLDAKQCPEAIRFDERLGFKPEGLMRKFGPHGEDMIMYALVRE